MNGQLVKEVPWDSRFEELKAYKEKYGTCSIPRPRAKDGPYKQLANWVNNQRTGYSEFMKAKKAGLPTTNCHGMTEERIARLEEIGFEWSVGWSSQWDSRYEELKAYKEKHGTCHVPYVKGGPHEQLANWVRTQRLGYSECS